MKACLESLFELLERHGAAQYGGEGVTQLQHALQCAALAESAGAAPALVIAALFHDLGHLVHELGEDATESGLDDHHQARGAGLLRQAGLPDAVWRPVALHVEAKRWLVASDAGYAGRLSAESLRSLALQGGAMTAAEGAAFRQQPFAAESITLRRWDDQAKDPEAVVPGLDRYRGRLAESIRR